MSNWIKGRRHVQKDAEGNQIFTARKVATWSVEQIVEKLGPRSPNFESSQKEFRVAFVFVTDGRVPVEEVELASTKFYIQQFTKKGPISPWFKGVLEVDSRTTFGKRHVVSLLWKLAIYSLFGTRLFVLKQDCPKN